MTLWETIAEAQAKKQDKTKFKDEGDEVEIKITQNGWYEEYVSMS